MEKVRNLPGRIAKSEYGLTSMEYALAAALVGVVIIASIVAVGVNLTGSFTTIATSIDTAVEKKRNALVNEPTSPGDIVDTDHKKRTGPGDKIALGDTSYGKPTTPVVVPPPAAQQQAKNPL